MSSELFSRLRKPLDKDAYRTLGVAGVLGVLFGVRSAEEKTMNRKLVAVALLLSITAPLIARAVPIGYCPGLDKLIDAADAIVVLRIDRHLSDFNSPTFYSTHKCYVYQTIKGDIPENALITLQLMNTEGSFATPYAHGSTHLMFLMKRATEDEPTEYRTLTFKGAQTLLSPLGHEKEPEGKTIKDKVRRLIKDAIAYQAQEHEKRQEFLKSLLLEKEAPAGVETAEEPSAEKPAPLGMQIPHDAEPREQIGQVLGRPVYRAEIRTEGNVRLKGELFRLFTSPVMKEYREAHKSETEPTEDEIRAATVFFDEGHRQRIKEKEPQLRARLATVQQQLARADLTEEEHTKLRIEERRLQRELKPPGRPVAVFMLRNWKFQKHLYERYGGGRILWQQAGLEAFDACRIWLESCEKQGDFTITDPKLRSAFYEYWTTTKHGAFLIDDKEGIRTEFLEPPWLPKAPSQE